jgi:hypothetical protein
MDSRIVNSQIKRRIWPRLREAGFDTFTSRTAWRHHEDRIDVVNFQSFNSYNAGVLGCTTYSFSVNLGCLVTAIPPDYEPSKMKEKGGLLLPQEYECHFRGRLARSFKQPELRERSIWYIDPSEKYLGWAITDIEQQTAANVLGWFERLAKLEDALNILLSADEDMSNLWGFGRNASPVRHYFTGYLALRLHSMNLAKHHLGIALDSGCFKQVEKRLASDLEKANKAMHGTCEDARA